MIEMFNSWCKSEGVSPLPAVPSSVAGFIADIAYLGLNKVLDAVNAVSIAHAKFADPTLSPLVSKAINRIHPVDEPRSWPKEHRPAFRALPYAMQQYLIDRDKQNDKIVRNAQNKAAQAEKRAGA